MTRPLVAGAFAIPTFRQIRAPHAARVGEAGAVLARAIARQAVEPVSQLAVPADLLRLGTMSGTKRHAPALPAQALAPL
jgi:hypothetical protein